MTILKRHMGRQAAAVSVAVAMLVLGLATPAYAATPTVTSVTPTTASDDCEVTIIGTNFTPTPTSVKFGGTNGAGEVIDSATQLEVQIPNTVGDSASANVVVTNNDPARSKSVV